MSFSANSLEETQRVASSLSWKERLSKFAEPTAHQQPSTQSVFACSIVGWYS